MLETLLDNPVTRAIAGRLEDGHNGLLGSRATMSVARACNRVKNLERHRFRANLYQQALPALFAESGAGDGPATVMRDGWALDTSRTLPGLERLLADGEAVIRERGGVRRGGGDRSFFQQILTDEHLARFPSILEFATSNLALRTVMEYMGLIPTLSVSRPLGVRLAESDKRFAPPGVTGYGESQLFHRDYHDEPMVYMIVALRDVTAKSGPFSILPAAASQRATQALRYGTKGCPYRITDEQLYATVDRKELFEFACPAGSVLFVDSSACFHYGSRDCEIPRYLMMYAYVSVCRTDFGDLLRKESDAPVVDDSARTRRSRYPVPASATRLQRLVLDREAMWAE